MSDNDFDYEENEERIKENKSKEEVDEFEREVDQADKDYDDEAVYMDDADDEWEHEVDEDEEDDDEEEDEENEEKEEQEEEEEEEETDDDKIRKDILKVVGDDTVLKIKGKEYRAGDLSANELVKNLQQGIRSDQIFQELAREREDLAKERERIDRDSRTLQSMKPSSTKAEQRSMLPKELQPSEYDSEEVKVLKETIGGLSEQVSDLRTSGEATASQQFENKILGQLDGLQKEYPMASVDEAVAVKLMRPDRDLSELMEISHRANSEGDFIKRALESNPEFKREYDEAVIAQYNLKKSKANRVEGTRRRPSASSSRMSTKQRVIPRTWEDASMMSKAYLKEISKMDKQ